jgi:hypothetical protein
VRPRRAMIRRCDRTTSSESHTGMASGCSCSSAHRSLFPADEVDLVFLSRADPLLGHRIMEHARLVYGSATLFARRKIYAFKRYQEHRKYFDMERDFVRRSLAEPAVR